MVVHRINESGTGTRTGLGTSGIGTSTLVPLECTLSIQRIAIFSIFHKAGAPVRDLVPHAYRSMCIKKTCLASILNVASLSKAFLLISVRPGPCAYSLDQSLGTGCHTVFGLGKHSTSYCKEPTRFGRVLSLSGIHNLLI